MASQTFVPINKIQHLLFYSPVQWKYYLSAIIFTADRKVRRLFQYTPAPPRPRDIYI